MPISQKVTLEQLSADYNNPYKDNFEESLQKAIKESCIDLSRKPSDKQVRAFMHLYIKGELTHYELELAIKKFGEKTACMVISNGNLTEFNDLRRGLKSNEEDMKKAEEGVSGRLVSEGVGKALQDHTKGTHAPSHSLHLNNGLGENAGFVSIFSRGYVWRLHADGYLKELNAGDVKIMFAEKYDIIPSDDEASKIAEILNKERRVFEGKMLQGEIGDSPTTKDAISIITNEGKKKGLAYDKTDQMGRNARKKCAKYDHEIGVIVGKAEIHEDPEELEKKYARHVTKFIAENNFNADNFVSLLLKAIPKFKRN